MGDIVKISMYSIYMHSIFTNYGLTKKIKIKIKKKKIKVVDLCLRYLEYVIIPYVN